MGEYIKRIIFLFAFLFSETITFGQSFTNVLNITAKTEKDREVYVYTLEPINNAEKILSISTLDSLGNAKLEFSIFHPQFLKLKIGKKKKELFFFPNDTTSIIFDTTEQNVSFIGKSVEQNDFLFNSDKLFQEFAYPIGGSDISSLSIDSFLNRVDSINIIQEKKYKNFSTNSIFSDEIKNILNAVIPLKLLSLKMNRYLTYYNPIHYKTSNIPNSLLDLESQTPLNSKLLKSGMNNYIIVLNFYLEIIVSKDWSSVEKDSLKISDKYLKIAFEKINKNKQPLEIKEYLLANSLYNSLKYGKGILFETYFSYFEQQFPNSPYLNKINEKLNDWIIITNNKIAPNFTATTHSGDKFDFNLLKDKVVYIDVWATWCIPCIKEIPSLKRLQDKYNINSKVLFLNISIDDNRDDWLTFLSNNLDFKGIHLNQLDDDRKLMRDKYQISSIPRYILLNKGLIVNALAPPPSSMEIDGNLDMLLK
ncbi:MAG: TlpA family protein disulfide reductase [Arcicella sp.]|jgi:thiol-disulfide isomerase/thioredoxin|nr:TlpA family protein disulfide reductase [Arcicella sp.]